MKKNENILKINFFLITNMLTVGLYLILIDFTEKYFNITFTTGTSNGVVIYIIFPIIMLLVNSIISGVLCYLKKYLIAFFCTIIIAIVFYFCAKTTYARKRKTIMLVSYQKYFCIFHKDIFFT